MIKFNSNRYILPSIANTLISNIFSKLLDSHGIFIEKAIRTFTNLYAITTIARFLSIFEFSQFSLWLLVIGCLRIIILGGYESYIFHSAAKYPRKARSELKIVITNRYIALLILCILVTFVYILFPGTIPIEATVLGFSLLSFPFLICNDFFLGCKENKSACLSAATFFIATLISIQSLHHFAPLLSLRPLLVSSIIYVVPRLMESIMFWLLVRAKFGIQISFSFLTSPHRNIQLFITCFPLLLTSFIGTVYSFSDQFLTYSYYKEDLMGLYNIAWKIPALFTLVAGTAANFLYLKTVGVRPHIPNKLFSIPPKRIMLSLFFSVAVISYLVSLSYCKLFLPIYFGFSYASISFIYSIYLCFYVLNLINLKSLLHLGRFKIILYKSIFSIILNLSLFFWLLESSGFLTAALSTLVSEVIVSLISTIYVQRVYSSQA